MKRLELQLDLAATPDLVSSVLQDIPTWPAWIPDVLQVDRISDTPIAMGSAWIETRRLRHRDAQLQGRTTEVDLPRTLAYSLEGDGLSASYRWRLAPIQSATLVTVEISVRSNRLLGAMTGLESAFLSEQPDLLQALEERVAALKTSGGR